MSIQAKGTGKARRYEVRWLEGGRHRSRSFDRKRDAEDFEAVRRRRAQLGAHAPAEPSPEPLRAWLEDWWGREAQGWARSTRLQRAGVLDKWVVPYVGDVTLRDLGEDRVQRWRGEILAAGCPPGQANSALSVLSSALTAARRARKVPANPCTGMRRLPVDVSRPRALSPVQIERLRAAMPSLRDAVLVSVLAYAGLRPEEAFALRWGDVGRTLTIWRVFTAGELRGRTKTGKVRSVEIVEPLAVDLEGIRPRVHHADDLVFPSPRGRPIDLHNWRYRVWKPATRAARIEAAPYDLRHSYISLLVHEGRSVVYVAAMAGNSPRMVLERYSHLFAEAELGTGEPMIDAIRAARADAGLRPDCDVRVLRASREPAGSAP